MKKGAVVIHSAFLHSAFLILNFLVHMPMRQLFGVGVADAGDFDMEVEGLTGEGMIAIDGNFVAVDIDDADNRGAFL